MMPMPLRPWWQVLAAACAATTVATATDRRQLKSCEHLLRVACDEAVAGGAACAVCTGVDANGVPVVPPDGCSKHDVRGFCADLPGGANGSSARNITMETTFYGARDNCPPGGAIAYPLLHPVAGGTGTYADPITFAGSKKALPKHTRVYVVELQKYFIMEDDCGECDHDWEHKQKYHIDLWIGSDKLGEGPPLIACENALTKSHRVVTVDPPHNLAVNSTPLYTESRGCILPHPPACHDTGTACGNGCDTPKAATCAELATEFHLTLARFRVLNDGKHGNPSVDCSKTVPAGTNVCMGGSCGD